MALNPAALQAMATYNGCSPEELQNFLLTGNLLPQAMPVPGNSCSAAEPSVKKEAGAPIPGIPPASVPSGGGESNNPPKIGGASPGPSAMDPALVQHLMALLSQMQQSVGASGAGGRPTSGAVPMKKDNPKILKGAIRGYGKKAPFPPPPALNGVRYYVTRASLTGEARIFAGAGPLHQKLLQGRSEDNLTEGECVGFASLDDAAAFSYAEHPGCTTVVLQR